MGALADAVIEAILLDYQCGVYSHEEALRILTTAPGMALSQEKALVRMEKMDEEVVI